ncbi:hypothetical protein [Mesorhizobium sp. ES1-4]|uniref:spike base protein, RCAP_Rcc01079 family n=1 Tax=Mesorhizobium sp. ES1-4 TaxID=2876627 RepID=UPI001CCF5A5E|nr:hypothetical protein [Mesorhizobium sp. ES1-4]MBZ9794322.1 hypothetical protein [Mesorhizobium sp. ES1-4]
MPYDAAKDPYATVHPDTLLANGAKAVVVDPSDTVDLAAYARAIVLLTDGDVSYLPPNNADGDTVDFTGLPAGWVSPHRVRRVMATGTTATVATVEG